VLFYQERTSASDQSQQITGALITGAIVLGGVLLATTAFILLYKYRCLKVYLSTSISSLSFSSQYFFHS
jgi:multisubunit Na+/H+ antiporter MnhC subunit